MNIDAEILKKLIDIRTLQQGYIYNYVTVNFSNEKISMIPLEGFGGGKL